MSRLLQKFAQHGGANAAGGYRRAITSDEAEQLGPEQESTRTVAARPHFAPNWACAAVLGVRAKKLSCIALIIRAAALRTKVGREW